MLPTRFVPGLTSTMRKTRLEGKPSMLPKPRRPGSTDRLSNEARRPSTTGHRSSSAEPARGTFGGGRLSKEASATKIQLSGRSRSQQSERFGQSSMTPLWSSRYSRPTTTPQRSRSQQSERFGQSSMTPMRSSHYSRTTTTPQRTPSEDRASRSWQTSLDRALAFVTIKDQRPLSNAAWQRAELSRVQEALAQRGGADGAPMALIRPLTIARFVDISGALLAAATNDAKLNNDNYVTKLPHLSKRLLYPGTVSKSWLKTVNTLHAFPHALALIAYLLDFVNHLEMPVCDDWLYVGKDDLSCLRRDYLHMCWIRFQNPGHQFEDLNEEYLQNLKHLLGDDEEKIFELQQIIKKYEACLEDEAVAAARADEARRRERREALLGALRAERAARRAALAQAAASETRHADHVEALRVLDVEIERASAESQQLKKEVEEQPLTVEERTRLLDEVDYALRVRDSKQALVAQIDKMLLSKESELALWQKKTLDSCVEYKQGLIHLSAEFPDLASFAIDEKELMGSSCAAYVSDAVSALRAQFSRLSERRAAHAAARSKLCRTRALQLEESRAKLSELKSVIQREQESLEGELAREAAEAGARSAELRTRTERLDALQAQHEEYSEIDGELLFWEKQDAEWRSRLFSMREYISEKKEEAQKLLEAAKIKRVALVLENIRAWNEKVAQ